MSNQTLPTDEAALRAQVQKSGAQLAKTLEALAHEVQPAVQVERLKKEVKKSAAESVEEVKAKAQSIVDRAKNTLIAAKNGDREARKKTVIVAGSALATFALLALRRR